MLTLLFWAIRKTVFNADNIKSSNIFTKEMYESEVPIIIEKNLATFEYDSLARGYHEFMDIWNPPIVEILKQRRSRTAATLKMELFVIIINAFQLLTIITKCSILDVAAVLDPPLLKCKWEPTNEVDKHAFAIIQSNSLGKESVVVQIPQNISKFSSMSLQLKLKL